MRRYRRYRPRHSVPREPARYPKVVVILAWLAVIMIVQATWAGGDEGKQSQVSTERVTGKAENTPETQATEWHGLPANNPGHDDNFDTDSAGGQGGVADELHGVNGAPQNGGRDDEPPACDFHGGFNGEKSQCVDG